MIYFTLRVSTLRSPEYIGSEPTARATWLNLLAYCCEQENGGIIPVCSGWKDRQWQQTCGITLTEAQEQSPLWQWEGHDLIVRFYPADKQAEIEAKREAGRRGGRRSGETRRQADRQAQPEASGEAELQAELQASLERNVMEGKVKERKVKGTRVAVAATSDEDWLTSLESNPAYAAINVRIELGKMEAWCSANGKQPSRRRFINWLNRAERPIIANGQKPSGIVKAKSDTPWEIKQRLEAITREIEGIRADRRNRVPDPEKPWESTIAPEAAARVKALRATAQELNRKLAFSEKEAA